MATLKEISVASGVSIRTVRRVLNNEDSVSSDKAQKVKDVLRSMNYVPNLLARGLRNKKTSIIGLIANHLSLEVRLKKFSAIKKELTLHGYSTMLGLTNDDDIEEQLSLDYSRFCDGIIFFNNPTQDSINTMIATNTPYVIPDSSLDIANAIEIDRESGITEAILDQRDNYESFFFITNSLDENDERKNSFIDGVGSINAKKVKILYTESGDFIGGEKIGEVVQKEKNSLSICYNDRIAAGVLKSLYKKGGDVPKDYGIVGFDNDDFTQYTHKSISTITQSVEELAKKTIELLESQIAGKNIKKIKAVKTKFIGRESTV